MELAQGTDVNGALTKCPQTQAMEAPNQHKTEATMERRVSNIEVKFPERGPRVFDSHLPSPKTCPLLSVKGTTIHPATWAQNPGVILSVSSPGLCVNSL